MIIYDYDRYIKDIRKNGIKATDIYATTKINDLLKELIFNTTYKKGKIIKSVKEVASDYYNGLPDDIITSKITELYDIIKDSKPDERDRQKKILTLYKSEMETIIALPDDKMQRLAFALLVAFKHNSHHRVFGAVEYSKFIADCLADAIELADFAKVSGTIRNKLLHELKNRGMLTYWKQDNNSYKYQSFDDSRKRWIAFNTLSIPFCVEVQGLANTEEIYMQMTNYDDIMLYLRYYKGDANVTTCKCCGTPILISGNAKRYCSDCAEKSKKASDKARYDKRVS